MANVTEQLQATQMKKPVFPSKMSKIPSQYELQDKDIEDLPEKELKNIMTQLFRGNKKQK